MQICLERIGENAILMHFHAVVLDSRSSEEPENIHFHRNRHPFVIRVFSNMFKNADLF